VTEHAGVQAVAAELALGLLSGPERADALAHLESCPACRTTVEEQADVADRLLLLAPEVDPPAGFETAVLARTAGADGSAAADAAPPRRWWRSRLAVAAVLVFIVGAVAGGVVTRNRVGSRLDREYVAALKELDGRALAAATLEDSDGQRTGQLFLYEGALSWLFVTVDDPGAQGDLAVELRFEAGRTIVVPGLVVRAGRGSLGATVDLRLRDLRGVRIVDGQGRQRYTVTRPH
jgi:hypothetical protein